VEAVQNRSRKKYGWGEGLVIELTPEASEQGGDAS
jgi:hypothetical protein